METTNDQEIMVEPVPDDAPQQMKTHMELCRTAIQSEINTDLEDNNISKRTSKGT